MRATFVSVVSLPAESLPAASLPVLDVDSVFARLPAESKAQLAWARKPIRDALARLAAERLDEQLLDSAAEAIWPALRGISGEFFRMMAERPQELAAAVMQDFGAVEDRLRKHLNDEDAADTLAWITGFLRGYFGLTASLPRHAWSSLAEVPAEEFTKHREARLLMRGYVALLAGAELSRLKADPERANELIDISFLELMRFQQELDRAGFRVSAFPFQTLEERRERQGQYAERLRQVLGPDDDAILGAARLGDLR